MGAGSRIAAQSGAHGQEPIGPLDSGRSRILIVEDELGLAHGLKHNLELENYEVLAVDSGARALAETDRFNPHLILLDLMLPDLDGLVVLTKARIKNPRRPIIVVSARASEQDRVIGLDAGANDYVVKPFGLQELLARIRVQLRKNSIRQRLDALGKLRLDDQSGIAWIGDRQVRLTPRECGVLRALISAQGKIVSNKMLLRDIWRFHVLGRTRAVDTLIKRLRAKLGDSGQGPRIIYTARGYGHYIDSSRLTPDS